MKKKWVAVIMCMCLLQIVPMNLKAEEQTSNYKGLGFTLVVNVGSESLEVSTSITD